jgi:phage baseplate assembly protein W
VVQLLQVGRNERVMRPDAGSQAAEFVFENNTEVLAELVAADVSQVLARYEPRILVTQIETTREDNGVVLDITYVQRSTGQVQTRQIRHFAKQRFIDRPRGRRGRGEGKWGLHAWGLE